MYSLENLENCMYVFLGAHSSSQRCLLMYSLETTNKASNVFIQVTFYGSIFRGNMLKCRSTNND